MRPHADTILDDPRLYDELTALAAEAAGAITAIAARGFAVRQKEDHSPVTAADEASEQVILAGLARLMPGLCVVSEESVAAAARPQPEGMFALIDPLDGTKEFVAGRPEYTVNIALVAAGRSVVGILVAPALGHIWRGARGLGAQRLSFEQGRISKPTPIRTRPWPAERPIGLVSRSHLDAASARVLERWPGMVREPCGSALKFCRLAEGSADVYPRLAPTSEWDIAAGDALLTAAGGAMRAPDGEALRYGNADNRYNVPGFIAVGDPAWFPFPLPKER